MELIKTEYEKGKKRAINKEYNYLTSRLQYLQKNKPGSPEITKLAIRKRSIPSVDPMDPHFKRLMYLRFADDFTVLITGSHADAVKIRDIIKEILIKECGLELNLDKTIITAIKDGFLFLGAYCKKISAFKAGLTSTSKGNPGKYRMRLRLTAPVKKIIEKLITNRFLRRTKDKAIEPRARKDLTNLEHHEIVTFFNQRIQGIYNFYTFAANLTRLRKIFSILQLSCALTLALKLKLRTKRKTFKKFGHYLKDPETDISLKIPKNLKVQYKYPKTQVTDVDQVLKTS